MSDPSKLTVTTCIEIYDAAALAKPRSPRCRDQRVQLLKDGECGANWRPAGVALTPKI
jgi:hypothetical protein